MEGRARLWHQRYVGSSLSDFPVEPGHSPQEDQPLFTGLDALTVCK